MPLAIAPPALCIRAFTRLVRRGVGGCVLLASLVCTRTGAQAAEPAAQPGTQRPRIALVLSGGGARGFAHVGLLKALESARVPVDWIVGTSMGAIVGGLYATGMDADTIERELLAVDWQNLFRSRSPRQQLSQRRKEEDHEFAPLLEFGIHEGEFRLPGGGGAVSTQSLEMLLRRYTLATRRLRHFDQLPTPFRAVATDMETGEPVVLDRGDLAAALRASMSVPGVFAPLELDGRLLGDGGLVDNLPVDVARALGAQVVIAVNIGTPLAPRDTLGSVLGVSAQMINILTEQNVQRSVATLTRQDLLLAPPLGRLASSDFARAPELVALGHAYAQGIGAALERFGVGAGDYQRWQQVRQAMPPGPGLDGSPGEVLAFVRVQGVQAQRSEALAATLESQAGTPSELSRIERDLHRLVATDDYARVDYRLEPDETHTAEGLALQLTDKDWGPHFFRLGLDLRTDFEGQSAFNLRVSHNRRWLNPGGAEWRNRLSLGDATGLSTEWYQPVAVGPQVFVSAHAHALQRKVDLYNAQGQLDERLRRLDRSLGLDLGWSLGERGRHGELRLGWRYAVRRATPELALQGAASPLQALQWTESGLRLSLVSDQLDHANFPQSGYRVQFEGQSGYRRPQIERRTFTRLDLRATAVGSWNGHTLNAHLRLARTNALAAGAVDEFSLGGFQQLSGYRVGQVVGDQLLLARLSYYRPLGTATPLTRGLFAGATLEAGNTWGHAETVRLGQLRLGSSLFLGADTGIGPVYLSLVHAPKGYTGLYLFVGRP